MKYEAVKLACVTFLLGASVMVQGLLAQPEAPSSQALSERAQRGMELFRNNCFVCHSVSGVDARVYDGYMDEDSQAAPVSLDGLFKRKALDVKAEESLAESLKEFIKMGPTPGMPGFRYTLSDIQIADIVEFLKSK